MSDLDTQIEDAIRKGSNLKDIAAHLDQSEDPSHKAWANNYYKRAPIESATPSNEGPSENFGKKTDEFAAKEKTKRLEEKQAQENQFGLPDWMEAPVKVGAAGAGFAAGSALGNRLFGGGRPPDDNTPPNNPPNNPPKEKPAISQSEAQKQIDELKLQREQYKTEQERIKHEKFVRQNTLTPEEQVLGRKFKDPADEILAKKLIEQQNKAVPTFNQGPALTSAVPSPQPAYTTSAPQPPVNMPPAGSVPAQMPPPAAPVAPTTPAAPPVSAGSPTGAVVATAATPEGITAATQATEKVKEAIAPTPEAPKAKEKTSIFSATEKKAIPGAERQLLGTFGYGSNPERAQAILNGVKGGLPENTPLAFDVNEKGISKGGMPNKEHVLSTTNRLMGTSMSADDFKAFRFTDENLNKMHTALQKEMEAAKTPAQIAKAQQGFADLAVMARTAGNTLGALALFEAYKHGKKTGDWSDLGLGVTGQIIGNVAPRLALPFALMTPTTMGSGTLDSPESKALFDRVYANKVGSGRGVAPPSAYMR